MFSDVQIDIVRERLRNISGTIARNNDNYSKNTLWIGDLFGVVARNLDAIDKYCLVNKKFIGPRFVSAVMDFDISAFDSGQKDFFALSIFAVRFIKELELYVDLDGVDRGVADNFIEYTLGEFSGAEKSQMMYAAYAMPASIISHYLRDSRLQDFSNFDLSFKNAKQAMDDFEKSIDEKKQAAQHLVNLLEELKTQANFVALNRGFEKINTEKRKDEEKVQTSIFFLKLFLFIIPLIQIAIVFYVDFSILKEKSFYFMPALVAIEFLMLYFYRVALSELKSIRSQIMQIDLRMTLCQFIQSYADFARDIKSKDQSSLDKFESIIFSNIVGSEDKIPATLDGIEQIGNLAKAIKS